MKRLTPRTARTFNQICDLPRDNWDCASHWILVEAGEVHIRAQRKGESPTEGITIPKRVFDKMVDFYNTGSTRARGHAS